MCKSNITPKHLNFVTRLKRQTLCFRFINGSLTRQRIMEKCAGNWETFAEMFHSTPPGNNGNIGIVDQYIRLPIPTM